MSDLSSALSNILAHPELNSLTEAQVQLHIIQPILHSLGWPILSLDPTAKVYPQYHIKGIDTGIVDYALLSQDKLLVLLEVKKAGVDLSAPKVEEQILNYAFKAGVKLALLTNGLQWRFYLPLQGGDWQLRLFDSFSLSDQAAAERLTLFLSKEAVVNGQALQSALKQHQSTRVCQAFPAAWNQLLADPSPALLKQLQNSIQQISSYQPETEMVTQLLSAYSDQLQLSSQVTTDISPPPPPSEVKSIYLNKGKNGNSIDLYLQDAETLRQYVQQRGWPLDLKFNQNYCGFKLGHPLTFGLEWSGSKSYNFYAILARAEADRFPDLPYFKVTASGACVYYQITLGQIDTDSLAPIMELAYQTKLKPPSKSGSKAPSLADQDTIVVPAREEGFQQTFLKQNAWWAIRIAKQRLEHIKYIAAYQVAPVSAITHLAEVSRIEPHADGGKYALYFKEAAQEIGPVKLDQGGKGLAPQAPRYTNREHLLQATLMSDLFS